MSPMDILLGNVSVAPVAPAAAPLQNPSGSQPFGQILSQLFNSIQLNPQDLSKLSVPVPGSEIFAAPGAENAAADFLKSLFQLLDGGQGLSTELQDLLAKFGLQVTDEGLTLAPGADPDQVSQLLNVLGMGLQEQNGQWVVVKDAQPVNVEQFIQAVEDKRQSLAVPQESNRQASYENATMDLSSGPQDDAAAKPETEGEAVLKSPLPQEKAAPTVVKPDAAGLSLIPAEEQTLVESEGALILPAEDAQAADAKTPDDLERIKNEALKLAAQAKGRPNVESPTTDGAKAPKGTVSNTPTEPKPSIFAASPETVAAEQASAEIPAGESTDGSGEVIAGDAVKKPQIGKPDTISKILSWNPAVEATTAKGAEGGRSDIGGDLLNQGQTWSGMHLSVLTQQAETSEAGRSGAQTFNPSTDLGRDLLHQIVDKAKVQIGRKETRIEIQLKPEFLGKLRIEVGSKQGEVSVSIFTENHAVKNILENNLQALRDTFAEHGLRLDNLQVTVDQQDLAQTASNPNGMAGEMAGGHDSNHEREGGRRHLQAESEGPVSAGMGFDRVLLELGRVDLFA